MKKKILNSLMCTAIILGVMFGFIALTAWGITHHFTATLIILGLVLGGCIFFDCWKYFSEKYDEEPESEKEVDYLDDPKAAICDDYCRYMISESASELEERCEKCPLNELYPVSNLCNQSLEIWNAVKRDINAQREHDLKYAEDNHPEYYWSVSGLEAAMRIINRRLREKR